MRAQPKLPAKPHPADRSGWTLGHAGRQVRIGPVAFWIIVGSLVVMAGWSATTATYFAFRDDVLTRLLARQAQMQFAYEDRIAELRGQVDRLASRQLLDQEQFESKLDQITRRQTMLEVPLVRARHPARHDTDRLDQAGAARGRPRWSRRKRCRNPRRSTTPSSWCRRPSARRGSNRARRSIPASGSPRQTQAGIEGALARLQASLDRFEAGQVKSLNALEESYDAKARRMRNVLADLGLDVGKIAPPLPARASGGPFVPANALNVSAFDRQLYRIRLARGQVDRLTSTLAPCRSASR